MGLHAEGKMYQRLGSRHVQRSSQHLHRLGHTDHPDTDALATATLNPTQNRRVCCVPCGRLVRFPMLFAAQQVAN